MVMPYIKYMVTSSTSAILKSTVNYVLSLNALPNMRHDSEVPLVLRKLRQNVLYVTFQYVVNKISHCINYARIQVFTDPYSPV